jgi:hypothetical protein
LANSDQVVNQIFAARGTMLRNVEPGSEYAKTLMDKISASRRFRFRRSSLPDSYTTFRGHSADEIIVLWVEDLPRSRGSHYFYCRDSLRLFELFSSSFSERPLTRRCISPTPPASVPHPKPVKRRYRFVQALSFSFELDDDFEQLH